MTTWRDTTAAAEYLGLAPKTLANWRSQRRGPEFRRVGRVIRYAESALDDFLNASGT